MGVESALARHVVGAVGRDALEERVVDDVGVDLPVDFSGKRPWIVDGRTGEVELFLAVLDASS
jgi:hypothetical protein